MTIQAVTHLTIEKLEIVEIYCYKQMSELFLRPDSEAFTIVNRKCFFTKSTQINFRGLVSVEVARYNVTIQRFCSPYEQSL